MSREEWRYRKKNRVEKATIMSQYLRGDREIKPKTDYCGQQIKELKGDDDERERL